MNETSQIRKKLTYWGIKQQWLADKLGVSKTLLSFWLSGTYPIPDDKLKEAKSILSDIPEPKK